MEHSGSANSSVAGTSGRSVAFEIDLNEAPLPSPRESGGGSGGVFASEHRCRSCGEVEGAMVICGDCGRRFHVECLGVREEQREWKCFECLSSGRMFTRTAGGGSGLFDMNSSPPQEADGVDEGYFVNSELVLAASFPNPKMQDMRRNPFFGFALSSQMSPSDMRLLAHGIPSQHPAMNMTRFAHLSLETATQKGNIVYLQALKDYITEKRGVLGDGWRVKFEYSEKNYKTSAIYFAPDGTRFNSMSEVAHHLGLMSPFTSFEKDEKGSGIVILQKGSHSKKRARESLKSQRVNTGNMKEVDSLANETHVSQSFLDGFPVQFEDFFVMSVGKINPNLSYHNTSQIWPIGYKSTWHDKFTGSIFVHEVLDGGDSGPIFRVHRYPCNNLPIPYASKVLCITKSGSTHNDDDDNDTNIDMMLIDDNPPPHLNDDTSLKITSGLTLTSKPEINLQNDVIGEFSIEERSISSAWQKAIETLLKAYSDKKVFNFCCKHRVDGQNLGPLSNVDSLGKFCYLAGPINKVLTTNEVEDCHEELRKWLEVDRFGLDVEFVQEIIEQLPGVSSCVNYKSLSSRCESSSLQTIGSGFFMALSKNGLQHSAVSNSLRRTSKRASPPGNLVASNLPPHLIGDVIQAYEICLRFYEVLGLDAPVSRQVLENELMNPWIDNIKPTKKSSTNPQKNLTLKQCEVNTPDDISGDSDSESDSDRTEAASKCTGVELSKFHMSILKTLIEDMVVKVKEIFDPFGVVESKSRKGKRKDAEVAVGGKKMFMNLDLFPVNELTWPEVARRFLLVALSMDGSLESSEVLSHECGKVFHCLNGDGGALCGSLTGVAAMEADAMVLAEASKKIFLSMNSKVVDFIIDQKENDTGDSNKDTTMIGDDSPEWIQALEPVKKLPTNVGARIRRCIHESLAKYPPEWAREILEHSITKEVYKGNASGPTKRAVISVLEKVRVENPQQKLVIEKKEKEKSGVMTLSDAVMKKCRVVLRTVANTDEDRIFFNLLAKTYLKPNDPDDTGVLGYPAMVARPLDFRTIDLRLAAGFYVTSHESFMEDVREVWENLRISYRDYPDHMELIETLANKFEEAYEEEVVNFFNKIMETGTSLDSSSSEGKKELNSILLETTESPIPSAPWEDGVCKVCGMDKDDDSVLLCDKCDSEYHTYCLDPPLARIPDGNWYCPSCMSSQPLTQDERCGTRALCRLRGKKKLQKEFTRNLMETLAPLADTMEVMEYWELGIEERVFLFKYLCEEALNSGIVRNNISPDSGDSEKKLRKLYKELKNQNKKEKEKESEDTFQEENLSLTKSTDTQMQTEENNENKTVGPTKAGQSQESGSLQEKIATLESKISRPVVRRDFLGRDLAGRLYWILGSPERVVVSGPRGRQDEGEMTKMPSMYDNDSLWTRYESDSEIQELIGWLRDDDKKEKELKETIRQWHVNRVNDDNAPVNRIQNVEDNNTVFETRARAALEKKFGSFSKKNGRKGKMVKNGKLYRCDCLELAGPTRYHCSSCHWTFLTSEELEGHNDGKCQNRQECEGPSKGKKVLLVKPSVLTELSQESDSPFVFEEIRAKFCTRSSLKEEVKDIGLIGSNGTPSFVYPQDNNSALFLFSETKKWVDSENGSTDFQTLGTNETPSKVERLKPKGISGKSLLKNKSLVRISQSSLKPLTGRVLEILRCLKINLLDMETALPEDSLKPSRGGLDRVRAWRSLVKSAQSIYEMVQATIMFEDMIKTDYLRKEWWYWSSPSTAAKISNISTLALRIYALDSAIYYEKPPTPTPNLDPPTEPVTPKSCKSEKSNAKDSAEKSTPKNNSPVTESSRPKTRSRRG